ncbi:hypothetical protein [Nocardia carnea]|uniref:hypothetical protein n=1 Tax=Nocardia carnea TaxID=37328 RepID=UPI002458C008|nr:hypothetical protein [Nocardia carnea]
MRRAARTVTRAMRDFALGIHLANGIRHGVPRNTDDVARRTVSPAPDAGRPGSAPGGPMAPAFTQPFADPAVVSSSRV